MPQSLEFSIKFEFSIHPARTPLQIQVWDELISANGTEIRQLLDQDIAGLVRFGITTSSFSSCRVCCRADRTCHWVEQARLHIAGDKVKQSQQTEGRAMMRLLGLVTPF